MKKLEIISVSEFESLVSLAHSKNAAAPDKSDVLTPAQVLPRPLNPRAVFRRIRFSLKNGQSPKARLHHRRFRRRFYASFGAMEGL